MVVPTFALMFGSHWRKLDPDGGRGRDVDRLATVELVPDAGAGEFVTLVVAVSVAAVLAVDVDPHPTVDAPRTKSPQATASLAIPMRPTLTDAARPVAARTYNMRSRSGDHT